MLFLKNPISNRHYYYSNCGSSIWWHFIVLYSQFQLKGVLMEWPNEEKRLDFSNCEHTWARGGGGWGGGPPP